ncbi:MAG: FkbM family methyltransferase [Anaerolineales bacterium]|nr:FkbM family methyltransferase [Anaerolineales bacterium]
MNESGLSFLGRAAAAVRNAGLQPLLTFGRNTADAVFRMIRFPPLSAEIDGIRLHGFLRHRSMLEEFARGAYEPLTRRMFRELVPSAGVFVDAGAHIGLFSSLAVRYGSPGLVVFSFEPDPYNQRAFRWNMNHNRCRNVRLFPAAVSDANGTARLLVSDGTIGSSLVLGRTKIGGTHQLAVETVALDEILRDAVSKPILVKMDIEGAEISALRGMSDTLRRAQRIAVFCEVNPEALAAGGRTPADLIAALRGAGLRIFFISDADGGLIPVTGTCNAKGNLLAVKDWAFPEDWIHA